jgi:hypothetical protein
MAQTTTVTTDPAAPATKPAAPAVNWNDVDALIAYRKALIKKLSKFDELNAERIKVNQTISRLLNVQ